MPAGTPGLRLRDGRRLQWRRRPLVMGIVNCTPDSFYDGDPDKSAAERANAALALVEAGADILDIGGESTRPGAGDVSPEEELERVLPVIETLRARTDAPLSIDTRKPLVAREALRAGADIVNDVTALREGPQTAALIAETGAAVVLMHMRGTPRTMQRKPVYADVVAEVCAFLRERARRAEEAGIAPDRIVLDPGFGFGKTFAHNANLLKHLHAVREIGYPVLVGMSRKSMIAHCTGDAPAERLGGSVALAALAAERGAAIVRVHDVRETVQALTVLAAVMNPEIRDER